MSYTQKRVSATIMFYDEAGDHAGKMIDVLPGANAAEALANAASIVAGYAAVSNAAISSYGVNFFFTDEALTPDTESEVQSRANVVVDLVTDATHKQEFGVIEIVSPADTIFLASSGEGKNIVDITDAGLVTLVGMYTAGAGQKAYLADRQTVETTDPIIRGKRFHRGSRKG